ncbi:MAG: glycosyltransferase family 9 protein [Chryseolinea sp.]
MDFKKRVNQVRRKIMYGLTKNVGSSKAGRNPLDRAQLQKILISRPNHRLGNLLLITPMVKELEQMFPNVKIDIFVKGSLGPIVFKNYKSINKIINLPKKPAKEFRKYVGGWLNLRNNQYDLVINIIGNSSSGRLSAKFANATYKFYGDDDESIQATFSDGRHLAKYPVYYLRRFLTNLGIKENINPIPSMDLKLSSSELAFGKSILQELIKNDRKTIALYTFATGNKCYSKDWWEKLYDRLVREFDTYNIVEVLPVENVSQLSFKAPSYYSKDVREIGSFIRNTSVFIGADSGIMHLASAAHAPTVGLFSVTDKALYEPYNGDSIGVDTRSTTEDELIKMIRNILKKEISNQT